MTRIRFEPWEEQASREGLTIIGRTWLPIETAPKDGTPLLLFSPSGATNTRGGLIWVSGGYRDTTGWRGNYYKEDPTHWMLLPEPPRR